MVDDSDNEVKAQRQSAKISLNVEDSPVINGMRLVYVHKICH